MSLPPEFTSFVRRLPKVELHVHLEGSIRPETLREIARNKGRGLEAAEEWIRAREQSGFRYPRFSDFLNAFKVLSLLLETPADYALAAARLIEELAAQNVRYAEITVSAGVVLWKKQSLDAIFAALAESAEEASRRTGVRVGWIFDAIRQFGVDYAREVLSYAGRFRNQGVVAFGIGGDEVRGPARWFGDVFREARALGLHATAHAGEAAGPECIRDAVIVLQAERIGHGTSAGADPSTIQMLAERQITVECCLSSNIATGVINRADDYPLRSLLAASVPVTINSDDPAFFNTSLEREMQLAAECFSLSDREIIELARNAIHGAFLPAADRASLLSELSAAASSLSIVSS